MATTAENFALARHYHQAGDLGVAEQLYNEVLHVEPKNADALHLLGVLTGQLGRFDTAIQMIRRALALNATMPVYYSNLGVVQRAKGQLVDAAASFQQALSLTPDSPKAHTDLATILEEQGKLDIAVSHFRQAARLSPQSPQAHNNLGNALISHGKLDEAKSHLHRALDLQPAYPEALNNLGNALLDQEEIASAVDCYRRALQLKPDFAEAFSNHGTALRRLGRLRESATSCQKALQLNPMLAHAHNNLGLTLKEVGKLEEAAISYQRALAINPNYAVALSNLGTIRLAQKREDEASACYEQAIRLNPTFAEARVNLAIAMHRQGNNAEAMQACQRALSLRPDYPEAHFNLGIARQNSGQWDLAKLSYSQALELRHDFAEAHVNRSLLNLLRGDFEHGWPEYEWRLKQRDVPSRSFQQPRWDSSSFAGRTLLLWAEHGLGDSIQFIRFAAMAKKRGGQVIVECQPCLARLFANVQGIDLLIPRGSPLPAFDIQAPLSSLPGIFGTSIDSIPATVPYFQASSALAEHWRTELTSTKGFKVGVVWQGNPEYINDRQRSIPLRQFAPFASVPGVQLFSLQKGLGADQLSAIAGQFSVIDFGNRLDGESGGFMDTAAIMQNLDLVICSDTAVPHLAGALGVPVWVALSHVPDWRWLLEREDSPWYPTMRLFRQNEAGNWDEVFERMARELLKTTESGS